MAWGANLLTNPSAETQDMTGWTSSGVSTEEKTTTALKENVHIKENDVTINDTTYVGIDGLSGTYAFAFGSSSNAYMYQVLLASDIGDQPENVQFVCAYKLKEQQNTWDSTVVGYAKLKIAYDDGTFDYFIIPLILGVKTATRYLTDFWVLVRNTCAVDSDKTLTYIEVRGIADKCEYDLLIDYYEFRKET